MKKKITTLLSMLAVMLLCTVTGTYAWGSLNQTALNEYTIMNTSGSNGSGSGNEGNQGNQGKPDQPETPTNPDQTQKPTEGTTGGTTTSGTTTGTTSDPTQSGKGDMTTGDTCQFAFYMLIMLVSFVVAIALGAALIALTVNEWEKSRRKQRWEEKRQY